MSERTKKILLLLLLVAISVALGYLVYYLFFKTQPLPTVNVNQPPTGQLPTAGANVNRPVYINVNGQLVPAANVNQVPPSEISTIARGGVTQVTKVSDTPIASPALAGDGQAVLGYNSADGKFYRYNRDGTLTALSDEIFYNVEKVYWAPDTDKAILKYPDDSTLYYNFQTKKKITFPKTWKDFDFSSDSEKLAFKSMSVDRENRWLSVTKEDGSSLKNVEQLGENAAQLNINWSPSNQVVGTFTRSIDLERQYLLFVGQNQEEYPTTIIEGRGYQGIWSPDSEYLFYSVYSSANDLKPNLWMVTAKGQNMGQLRTNLGINTWADKCAFANNYLAYCAVPRELQRGAGLVPETADATPDDFYQVDLRSATKTLLAVPDSDHTAKDLLVSADGNYLYFTDKNSGQLNQIKLK